MLDDGLKTLFAETGENLGLTRPASLCFAAIWRAPNPPCADDLVQVAGISRSNVSTALKELRAWGLVAVTRVPGDRREFFVAPADPWMLVRQMLAERERRVLSPAVDRLRALRQVAPDGALAELSEALETMALWQARLARLEPAELQQLMQSPPAPQDRKKKKKSKKS
ncbi:GbsR/MarR family transcriptional regulator [Frigidibacter oleivorans]|uniref:GbsR/MarR family transcriptional regulator n=1 Tax=Frigidibacter oleivorans TaxID=2487129 RepID=UPI000F8E808B|nr:MarR family transcriptional regulator [Frigidibacter oleivorans]